MLNYFYYITMCTAIIINHVNLAIIIQYKYLFILYKKDLIWFCKNGISCKLILNSDFMYGAIVYNIILYTLHITFSILFVILQ